MTTTFEIHNGESYKFYLEGYHLFATMLDTETMTVLTPYGTKLVLPCGVTTESLTSNTEINNALIDLATLHTALEEDSTNDVLRDRYTKHLHYTKTLVDKPVTQSTLQDATLPFADFATITTEIRGNNLYINFEKPFELTQENSLNHYMRTYQNQSCNYAVKEECLPYIPSLDLYAALQAQSTEKCRYLTFYSKTRNYQGVLYSNVEYVFTFNTNNTLRDREDITNTLIRCLLCICSANYTF